MYLEGVYCNAVEAGLVYKRDRSDICIVEGSNVSFVN